MNKYCIKAVLITCMVSLLLVAGCKGLAPSERTTVAVPISTTPGSAVEIPKNGIGINPAGYTIENYDRSTIDIVFTVYNEQEYGSNAIITIKDPLDFQLEKNPGYTRWEGNSEYIKIIGDLLVPAQGSKDITVRIYVPEDVGDMPGSWVFWVAYQLEGFRWGYYQPTSTGNFVFFPSFFLNAESPPLITDNKQELTLLTWGNSPQLMVRAGTGTPPETPQDGVLIYRGYGEQVFRKWLDEGLGKILDRQYTKFTIKDDQNLSPEGGQKLFYRVWLANRVNGVEDGTWVPLGRSIFIPQAEAKVLIST